MADELWTLLSKPAGALSATRTIDLDLKLDGKIKSYVDFMSHEMKVNEMLQDVRLLPHAA